MALQPGSYPQPILVPTRPWPAIAAATLIAIATIGAVVALALFGDESHTPVIVSLFGFATALTASLITLIKVGQVSNQVDALHQSVTTIPQKGSTPQEQGEAEWLLVKAIASEVVSQLRTKQREVADVS